MARCILHHNPGQVWTLYRTTVVLTVVFWMLSGFPAYGEKGKKLSGSEDRLNQQAVQNSPVLMQLRNEWKDDVDKHKTEFLQALHTQQVVLKEHDVRLDALGKRFDETLQIALKNVDWWQSFLPSFLAILAITVSIAGVVFPYAIGWNLRKEYRAALAEVIQGRDEARNRVHEIETYITQVKQDLVLAANERIAAQRDMEEGKTALQESQRIIEHTEGETKRYMEEARGTLARIVEINSTATSILTGMQKHLSIEEEQTLAVVLDKQPDKVRHLPEDEAQRIGKKLWANGITLHVRFLDGAPEVHEEVKQYAQEWTKYANLTFAFDDAPDAEIRISFAVPNEAWSSTGTDALGKPANEPTMNLGWVDYPTVVREFGNAIGLPLEHQIPNADIPWNMGALYRDLTGPPNSWSRELVQSFFQKEDSPTDKAFDPQSIMMNLILPQWTRNGFSVGQNKDLSEGDKAFIAKLYPRQEP